MLFKPLFRLKSTFLSPHVVLTHDSLHLDIVPLGLLSLYMCCPPIHLMPWSTRLQSLRPHLVQSHPVRCPLSLCMLLVLYVLAVLPVLPSHPVCQIVALAMRCIPSSVLCCPACCCDNVCCFAPCMLRLTLVLLPVLYPCACRSAACLSLLQTLYNATTSCLPTLPEPLLTCLRSLETFSIQVASAARYLALTTSQTEEITTHTYAYTTTTTRPGTHTRSIDYNASLQWFCEVRLAVRGPRCHTPGSRRWL